MKKTKRIFMIVLYIGIILLSTKVYAKTGVATSETVRIRKEDSTTSNVVTLISQGDEVEILEEKGDWYKVSYKTYTGYIRKDMISIEEKSASNNTQENTTSSQNTTAEDNQENNTQNENTNQNTVAESNQEDNTQNENVSQNTSAEESNETNNLSNTNSTENETQEPNNQNETPDIGTNNSNEIMVGYNGKVNSNIEIKILPSINSSIIGEIKGDSEITVTDIINKWCYVESEELNGWILISKIEGKEIPQNKDKEETVEPKEEENTTQNETANEQEKTEEDEKNTNDTNNTNTTDTANTTEKKTEVTKTKYVSTETLNVRKKPENNAEIVDHITLNTEVTVTEEVNGSWSKIKTKKVEGYVASKYLSDSKTDISSRSQEIVRKKVTEEPKEEPKSSNESSSTQAQETTTSTGSAKGQEIVAYAKQYLGSKYVSGGTSPSTGFDCSGFTYYVYKHFGITLNRTSTAQISNGTGVAKSDLQAGDLVIFNNSANSKIGHVGIYIGGNTFIHAANSKKGVITTSLSDSYYAPRYVGGRRIVN